MPTCPEINVSTAGAGVASDADPSLGAGPGGHTAESEFSTLHAAWTGESGAWRVASSGPNGSGFGFRGVMRTGFSVVLQTSDACATTVIFLFFTNFTLGPGTAFTVNAASFIPSGSLGIDWIS